MITTTAYILISTIISYSHGEISTQTSAIFSDKASCESAATRQDFVFKNLQFMGRWNLTCHPYQLSEVKK